MSRLRVTIAGSMGLVALAAAGMAAFRYPSPLTASGVFSLAVAILFAAWVAAICLRGRARAIWASFALCGSGYMALSLGPIVGRSTNPYLATTTLLDLAYEHCYLGPFGTPEVRTAAVIPNKPDKWARWNWPEAVVDVRMHNSSHYIMAPDTFLWIGHSLFSLPIALAGGLLGRRLGRGTPVSAPARNDDSERSPVQPHDHP